MKFFTSVLGIASVASAHTMFSTLYIDGKNQGDGTCVRMPLDGETATNPIHPVTGADMACGRDGAAPVTYVCPAKKGATLTFEFRMWPDAQKPGSIDPGHQGPCAVYAKKVDDMFADSAAGPGWFKIWEDGFDEKTQQWCVDTLIENNGLLSVNLPTGLPAGYYLIRPEIVALHWARRGDPQYFAGCAQIFVDSNVSDPLDIPGEFNVTIPGYVDPSDPGLTYNIYEDSAPYPIPGPKVYIPSIKNNTKKTETREIQAAGVLPKKCIIKNANWCAYAIQGYNGEAGCWRASNTCYEQSQACWKSAPASGSEYCYVWSSYCAFIDNQCNAGIFEGPPPFNSTNPKAPVLNPVPTPWRLFEKQFVAGDEESQSSGAAPTAVTMTMTTTTSVVAENTASAEDEGAAVQWKTLIETAVTTTVTATASPTSSATKRLVTRLPRRVQM